MSEAPRDWLDPDEWHRVGRGFRREFESLTGADIAAVIASLPEEFAPYPLVAHELVKRGATYSSQVTPIRPATIDTVASRGVWQFFLVSEKVSPELASNLSLQSARSLAVNGAINIQHGRTTRDGHREPTSFGLVARVATSDGERVEHSTQESIYRAAVRTAAHRLH